MSKYSYQIPIITLIASLAAHSSSQVHPGQLRHIDNSLRPRSEKVLCER